MGASTQLHVPQCIIKLFIASGYYMILCWISASSFTLEMLTFRRSLEMRLNKDHCLRPVTPVHCQWHPPSLRSFDSLRVPFMERVLISRPCSGVLFTVP